MNEIDFYNKIKNWSFSDIGYTTETLTDWDMFEVLKEHVNSNSKVLDLGTGGGEKVIDFFPECQEILATDLAEEMVKTAEENLKESGRENITFRVMDNLKMDVPDNYFDVVVARHTIIDAEQVYKSLKKGGKLIVRGVDQLDCWQLKRMFNTGQGFNDPRPLSVVDYENIIDAGFKHVELIPIHVREYYKTKEDLLALLMKTPILSNFSEMMTNTKLKSTELSDDTNKDILNKYIEENRTEKGILLLRRYYGIVAIK